MPISPGPATNAGTAANLFETRVTDPGEGHSGKEVTGTHGQNAGTAANLFETRVTAGDGQH